MFHIILINILGFLLWTTIIDRYTAQQPEQSHQPIQINPISVHSYLRFRPRPNGVNHNKNISLLINDIPLSDPLQ